MGSSGPKGLSMTCQSGRCASTSEPMRPRSGMNGMPFSAAWNPACSAGQVASATRIEPAFTAAVKRGAAPNSPRLTAEVSMRSTQPAPISRSACSPEVGSAMRLSRLTPRRINARVAAMATPETSRGTASTQPSVIGAMASSRLGTIMREVSHIVGLARTSRRAAHARPRCSARNPTWRPTRLRRYAPSALR